MKYSLKLAAALLLTGAAMAQPAAPDRQGPPKPDMAKLATQMCQDRFARGTGEMAALEVKLALTDKQKPLFERWKQAKLAALKAEPCLPPPKDAPKGAKDKPSMVDMLRQEEKFLQMRLSALKAELPALETLFASLNETQKEAFAPPPKGRGPGRMDGPPPGGPGMGHGMRLPQDEPPPDQPPGGPKD